MKKFGRIFTKPEKISVKPSGRRKQLGIVISVGIILAVFMVLTVRLIMRRTAWITLPDAVGTAGISISDPVMPGRILIPVEITPRTVQSAAAVLSRPDAYRRTVTVTQFWTGGSGSYSSDVSVSGGRTRVDRTISPERIRHTLTDQTNCYLWYNDSETAVRLPAGEFTGDIEQHIPTYEEILSIPSELITAADYRQFGNRDCIYVETSDNGYIRRYWIGVKSGLLEAAEILYSGTVIYRMEAGEIAFPEETAFVLPDGSAP